MDLSCWVSIYRHYVDNIYSPHVRTSHISVCSGQLDGQSVVIQVPSATYIHDTELCVWVTTKSLSGGWRVGKHIGHDLGLETGCLHQVRARHQHAEQFHHGVVSAYPHTHPRAYMMLFVEIALQNCVSASCPQRGYWSPQACLRGGCWSLHTSGRSATSETGCRHLVLWKTISLTRLITRHRSESGGPTRATWDRAPIRGAERDVEIYSFGLDANKSVKRWEASWVLSVTTKRVLNEYKWWDYTMRRNIDSQRGELD